METNRELRGPVVFAGGGSGGHLYPALAVAEAIRARVSSARFVFFGTDRTIDEQILASTDCQLIPQSLPAVSRVPWRWPGIWTGLRRSTRACRERFALEPPALVVGTGGLSSLVPVWEAKRVHVPVALLNPDAVPGRANRRLALVADIVFTQWEDTSAEFAPGTHIVVSGCPVRDAFNHTKRDGVHERFGLDPNRKTLLVTGASQGAHSVNELFIAHLDFLESMEDWQILHLTGEADHERVKQAYRQSRVSAAVLPFTYRMAEALTAADLVVARAGASTIAEITALGRASILLPYPHHRDRHQLANARCLVRARASRILHDDDAAGPSHTGARFRELLQDLIVHEDVRSAMADAARRSGRGNAAAIVADRLLALASCSAIAVNETMKAVC